MNFATTWWVSGRFPRECVWSLRNQVAAQGHILHVHSNADEQWVKPLEHAHGYRGWWSKLELFRPDLAHMRPMLFMDLDTIVLGDLSVFDDLDADKLWMVNDWYKPRRATSSLLLVPDNQELCESIWDGSKTIDRQMGTPDGDYLERFPHYRLQDHVDGILSYKADNLSTFHVKPEARIVCFHGKPKPWDLEKGWAQQWYQSHV